MQELHDHCNVTASIIRRIGRRTQPDHLRAVDTDVRESSRVFVDTSDLASDRIVGELLLGIFGRELGLKRINLHKISIPSEKNRITMAINVPWPRLRYN